MFTRLDKETTELDQMRRGGARPRAPLDAETAA